MLEIVGWVFAFNAISTKSKNIFDAGLLELFKYKLCI